MVEDIIFLVVVIHRVSRKSSYFTLCRIFFCFYSKHNSSYRYFCRWSSSDWRNFLIYLVCCYTGNFLVPPHPVIIYFAIIYCDILFSNILFSISVMKHISYLDFFFFTTSLSGFLVDGCWLVPKSYLFYNPMDSSLPSSPIHGILQARILEWIAISFSRGSTWSRDKTCVLCLEDGFFTSEPPGKPVKHQRCPKTQKMIRNIGGGSSAL